MGVFAQAIADYAQPLLEHTDGSEEQLNKAFAVSQFCFNLALTPEDSREKAIGEMRLTLKMDEEEFDEFRRTIILPMIERHHEMFPRMHMRGLTDDLPSGPEPSGPSLRARPRMARPAKASPVIDRYAPCPCNSGQKYKFCCGKKSP